MKSNPDGSESPYELNITYFDVVADPDNPDPTRHPKLVTPAVLLMCSDDAPTGTILQAGNGRFATCAIFSNDDLEFGADVTYEDLLAKKDQLLDMSAAQEGWSWRRKRAAEADS